MGPRESGRSHTQEAGAVRKRLQGLGLRPRRRYGQHFLTSRGFLERIVEAAQLEPGDTVVEIGAGLGDLTEVMSTRAHRIVALELDPQLCRGLRDRFHASQGIEVVLADALRWPLPDALQAYPRPLKIVGNLPYNVGTQILMRFIRFPRGVDLMAMMFQKEVAERLVARAGTPEYGGITLMAQVDWEVQLAFGVPSSAFLPRPKVDSALVVFRPLPKPRVELGEWSAFVRLVRAAFAQRRKTLRNALKGLSPEGPRWSMSLLERAGIESTRRGETLTLEEFARLSILACEALAAGGGGGPSEG